MKDKEKQIMELMKDKEFVKLVRLIDNTHPFYVETIALRVYEKYQPKLPEDSVVIPNKITEETSAQDLIKIAKYNDKIRKQVNKETAEKFYDKICTNTCVFTTPPNVSEDYNKGYVQAMADHSERIDQVAKQFGVEIKE